MTEKGMSPQDQPRQSEQFLQRAEIHGQWESDYLNPDMDRFYDLAFDDIVRRLQVRPTDRILDAGCGYCYHTVRLARCGAQITAVDFSEAALAVGRRTIADAGFENRVSLQKADLTRLEFEDATFNYVISWGVIMHIPQMEAALSELVRVLKPGGTLVLCENNMHSLDVAIRERAIRAVKKLIGRPLSDLKRTPRGLEEWNRADSGGLMVRKTDMRFLERFLAQQGAQQRVRTAGQFTEAYTNMPSRALKRLIYGLNGIYFKWVRLPQLAIGNIVYFDKLRK
jgi:ubiquinone/menaquinone biosynthesis C-methylase UbiE